MKKIILPWVAGMFALIAMAPPAHAQLQKDSDTYAKNERPKDATVNDNGGGNTLTGVMELKNVSSRALKDFTRSFKNPEAVHWYKDAYGFIAYCTVNGIRNRSNYDKKGNWLYSSRTYDEKKLPTEVRAQVKRVYYDFTITGVQEIRIRDKMVYLVYMHDDSHYQTVRVTEDDMDILASYPQ